MNPRNSAMRRGGAHRQPPVGNLFSFPHERRPLPIFFGICSMTSSRDIPAFRASKSGAWAGPGPVFPPGEFAENELPSETH
jgi:hypothetical protein